ncbi:O-antigen ligase [Variovorax boronicumulans]|uniref:O-antigen ligase family protein n=1 Tax=Variovorax boronicumulans TaxID=436515 RepID=UPI00277DA21B|nr:O-antigen ligase family protein [Variovorax boronicumulans]MDQ0035945.1 O-antigen ligase [Variovorax boronicumulans]
MNNRDSLEGRTAALLMAVTAFCASWGASTLIAGVSLFRAVAFASMALLIFNAVSRDRARQLAPPELSLSLLWVWCLLSLLWSLDPELSAVQIFSVSLLAFMLFMGTSRLSTEQKTWKLIGAFYVLGCAFACMLVVTNSVDFSAGGAGDERATVGELNANFVAYAIATSIPMALTLLSYLKRRVVKLAAMLYFPVAMSSILLTGSRGALIAGGAALIVYFLVSVRKRFFASLISIASVSAGLYFLFDYLPDSVADRMSFFSGLIFSSGETVDLSGRQDIWPIAIDLFFDNLVAGIGFGAFRAANPEGISVHNVFLTMAAETGLVGLALFLFTMFSIFRRVIFKSPDPEVRKGGLLLLVTWLPIALTGVWEASAVAWMAFGWYYGASKHPYVPTETDGEQRRRLKIRW